MKYMFKQRIDNLRKKMKLDKLDAFIVTSKANRYYLSGFTGTYARIIIDMNSEYVIADGRYFYQLKQQSPSFQIIDDKMQKEETLANFIKKQQYQFIGIESQEMNVGEYLKLKLNTNLRLIPTRDYIEHLRMHKDTNEYNIIKKNDEIAAKALRYILTFIRPGLTEKEIANELDNYGMKLGADDRAFETIISSGRRSSLPHGHASNKIIEPDDSIIIDYGFKFDHYYSDVTRTVHFKTTSEKIHDIYNINLEAQRAAISSCEIGKPLKEIDAAARRVISKYGYGKYFLHGLGHGIGLTVHEYPLLNPNSTATLQAGMTFTTEPGIYIDGLGGVRIEDDQYMGYDNKVYQLTHIPKEWEQFEIES